MNQTEYRACMSENMKGTQLSKEERKLEFCVTAKLCSKKAGNRDEAVGMCNQPKEPKQPKKSRSGKGGSCKVEAEELAFCMLQNLEASMQGGSGDIEEALGRAAVKCLCSK